MSFTEKDYAVLKNKMYQMADVKYRDFNISLIPNAQKAIGIRVPQLRILAKEIAKQDYVGYLKCAKTDTHEETMLMGMVIGICKCDIEAKLSMVENFVPLITNWAICDIFCGDLKAVKKYLSQTRQFLNKYIYSTKEFERRFAVVMLMQYFVSDEYIDDTLNVLQLINKQGYYVQMAVAWALSVCMVKQPDKALKVFMSKKIEPFTHNKAIQKCCDSYRISSEQKCLLKTLKQ